MSRTLAVVLTALAAALVGCGASASSANDFEGEQEAVAEAIEDVQTAGERQNTEELCGELLTQELAEEIAQGGRSCATEMEAAIDDANDFELDVTAVTVNGGRAEARVAAENGERSEARTFELVKEGDQWKLASLG